MEAALSQQTTKIQVNFVKKGNLKDAKYVVIEQSQFEDQSLKELMKQAKNKFKQAKFNSVYHFEGEVVIDSDLALRELYSSYLTKVQDAGDGLKPKLTLVFCPEKDLQIKSTSTQSVVAAEEVQEHDPKKVQIKICAKETLVEEEAIKQLHAAARLPGCTHAFGMPDLHPGKGIPIGASIVTKGMVYPELVDYDIGCGMSFIRTGLQASKMNGKKLEQLSQTLISIDCPWGKNVEQYMNKHEQISSAF